MTKLLCIKTYCSYPNKETFSEGKIYNGKRTYEDKYTVRDNFGKKWLILLKNAFGIEDGLIHHLDCFKVLDCEVCKERKCNSCTAKR